MRKYIVWDFNGTLLDDVEAAVLSVNESFKKVGIAPTNREEYRHNMDMPIYKYYEKHADLDKIPMSFFEHDFLMRYEKYSHTLKLSENALFTVKKLHETGVCQCVISSFEQNRLVELLKKFGLFEYMDGVFGADNTKCLSKIDRGIEWMKTHNVPKEEVLVVGDMVHDRDMAEAMGVSCLLYSGGHQERSALTACGARVIDDLREVLL